jgi:hypothetical protein
MLLAAIAMYTLDLCIITPSSLPEDNFYHLLNRALRRRDPNFLREGRNYMYYLMRGLEALPAYTSEAGGWLWRGVSATGRQRVVKEYTLMRQVAHVLVFPGPFPV